MNDSQTAISDLTYIEKALLDAYRSLLPDQQKLLNEFVAKMAMIPVDNQLSALEDFMVKVQMKPH